MKIEFSPDDLRPLVELIVDETLEKIGETRAKLSGRLAYPEPEAAALLGVQPHVLRDARLRGEIVGSKAGKKTVYERTELLKFLQRNRTK